MAQDVRVVPKIISSHCHLSRAMSFDLHSTPGTCADPRTGYEPNRVVDSINPIVTEQESVQSTEESQIPEIEDKFSLPYNQSLLSSNQDSFESLAPPQQSRLGRRTNSSLLASPRKLPEREAIGERSQTQREGLLSSSSQSLNFIGTGKLVAWLSHQKRLGQDEFSEREHLADVFQGIVNRFSEMLTRRMLQNLFLREIEITCSLKRDLN